LFLNFGGQNANELVGKLVLQRLIGNLSQPRAEEALRDS
jgi:hypothetical protein